MNSPNCCIEFWEAVQYPEKLVICVLRPVPEIAAFLEGLKLANARVCEGFDECVG
jgi:hypothetical protein